MAGRGAGCDDVSGAVHLIRHALAGDRRDWDEADEERPLTAAGRAQAEAIAGRYRLARPGRIVSSPARRCVETVEPVAALWGCSVECVPYLGEGADPKEARRRLLDALGAIDLVLACTHGDVLDGVVSLLMTEGVRFEGPVTTPKSVTFELAVRGGAVASARVVPPPRRA